MPNADFADEAPEHPLLTDLEDGALLALARAGSHDAYAALFERYSYSAYRLARHLGQRQESDDVVSESFAKVLALLQRGKGPETAFRAYLFTTIRHEVVSRAKQQRRVVPTDDVQQIGSPVPCGDGKLDDFERTTIRAAYESLPVRWRTVLWHLEVEGLKPLELGPMLDLSPNSISALVYRARSGLREAYLQQHVNADGPVVGSECSTVRAKMSSFVRHTAARRDEDRISAHLQHCQPCLLVQQEVVETNQQVGGRIAAVSRAQSSPPARTD